jgi:spore germination protein KB
MLKENISLMQLFALMVNYLLGSAIVIGVGKEAQQNGWIAIGLATLIGLGLVFFYYSLMQLLPNKNLFEIMEYCFLRPITIFLSMVYVTYFLYISARVLRTFAEMINAAIMPQTPIEIIILTTMLLLAYILYLGLEVLGRIAEIFSPYLVGFFILLAIFLPISGAVQVHRLLPVLGDGMRPVLKAIFPSLIVFPFGELVVFTIILSSVKELRKSRKTALYAVMSAGLSLTAASLLMTMTLSIDAHQYSNFPLLSAARLVSVGEFIERIDPIVVFLMLLGVIIKSGLYLYCSLKGLEYVLHLPYRYFAFPISMLMTLFTILIAFNYGDHLQKSGYSLITNFHLSMELVIPGITLIFLIWKVKRLKNTNGKEGQ